MKRICQSILHIALLAAVGVFAHSALPDGHGASAAQPKRQDTRKARSPDLGKRIGCKDVPCNGNCARGRGVSCTSDPCNAYCGRGRGGSCGPFQRAMWGAMCAAQSGQPFIDPWARADWIAAQRASNSSWHAGYYHTAWGAPVALMVSPHARMHTRWGWGVAQSTMHPLYHQFERPYPGPVAGDAAAGVTQPLMPTPRWPSHTDQFGVYYVRGPW